MAAGSDRSVENLIQGSERLIQELIDTGIPEADAASLAADIEANIRKGEMAALDALETAPSDARAEVSASEDGMIANATFFPPTGDRPPLDLDDVRAALDAAKVRAGIDWDAIKDALLRCNTERVQVHDVVAARGIAPTSAMPSFLVISRELRERRQKADSPRPHRFPRALPLHPRQEGRRARHLVAAAGRKDGVDRPRDGDRLLEGRPSRAHAGTEHRHERRRRPRRMRRQVPGHGECLLGR